MRNQAEGRVEARFDPRRILKVDERSYAEDRIAMVEARFDPRRILKVGYTDATDSVEQRVEARFDPRGILKPVTRGSRVPSRAG